MNAPEQVDDSRLEGIIADYMRRVDRGEEVDREALIETHPEFADDLRAYFESIDLVDRMAGPAQPVDGGNGSAQQADESDGNRPQSRDTLPPSSNSDSLPESSGPQHLRLPENFGRYRIIRQLGQGAMGAVFLAEDTELERRVALKIPKFSASDGPEMVERFIREARAAATLHHRNICPVYDIGEIDGLRYISMAYIDGQPLSSYIHRDKAQSDRQVAILVRKLALALEEAHAQGIVHRDLKPDNIMVDEKGEPVIMDFGLARRLNSGENSRLTQTGMIIGSPAYMSPEQVEGELDQTGPLCDVYSLGVILYEMLAGELPFAGSIAAVIGQIIAVEPRAPSKVRSELDGEIEAICLKMMAKRTDHRYQSMREAADALGHFIRTGGSGPADPRQSAARHSGAHRSTESSRLAPDIQKHKAKVESLCRRHKYTAAIRLLEGTARETGPDSQESAAWAKQEIPKIRAMLKKVRSQRMAAFRTAQKLMRTHDYVQAAGLLEQIPPQFRIDEMNALLDEATNLQKEVDWLVQRLDDAVEMNQFDGLIPHVERLLELKPGHAKARQLHQRLTARQQRSLPFLLKRLTGPYGTRNTPPWLMWTAVGIMAATLAVIYGVMTIRVPLGEETVKIEVAEAAIADGVSISVDGDKKILIENLGETITLEPGEHSFVLYRGEEVIQNPESFTVTRDGQNVLNISLEEREIAATTADEPIADAAAAEPAEAPPVYDESHPTLIVYDAETGQRPAEAGWKYDNREGAGSSVNVSAGVLTHEVPVKDRSFWTAAFPAKEVTSGAGVFMEVVARVDREKHTQPSRGVNLIELAEAHSDRGSRIVLYAHGDTVFVNDVDDKEAVAPIFLDTTERFRTYRMELKGETFWLFIDGVLTVTGQTPRMPLPNGYPAEKQALYAKFGDGSQFSGSKTELKRVVFGSMEAITSSSSTVASARSKSFQPVNLPRSEPGEMWVLKGHSAAISDLAVSADSRWIASCGNDQTFRIWDVSTGKQVHVVKGEFASAAFSPAGDVLLLGPGPKNPKKELLVLGVGDWKQLRTMPGVGGTANDLAISRDGKQAISSTGGRVWLWDVERGTRIRGLQNPGFGIQNLGLTPDGRIAFGSGGTNKYVRWDTTTGQMQATLKRPSSDMSILSSDGTRVLAATWNNRSQLLDFETGKVVKEFISRDQRGSIRCVALSPDGRYVLTGSQDKHVRVFDVATGKRIMQWEGHNDPVHHVAFSPDGRFAVSAGDIVYEVKENKWRAGKDHTVRVWRLPGGAADDLTVADKARQTPGSSSAAVTYDSTSGKLPSEEGWELHTNDRTSQQASIDKSSKLLVHSESRPGLSYWTAEIPRGAVRADAGVFMEASARVLEEEHRLDNRGVVLTALHVWKPGSERKVERFMTLVAQQNRVFVTENYRVIAETPLDTSDRLHTYRVELEGNELRLFVDESLKRQVRSAFLETVAALPETGNRLEASFGDLSTSSASRTQRKHVTFGFLSEAASASDGDSPETEQTVATSEWTELFNGRNLSGWNVADDPKGWSVRLRHIIAEGDGRGFLWSEGEYDDFELELEYRLDAGANSGVFIRAPQGAKNAKAAIEIALIDNSSLPPQQQSQIVFQNGALHGVSAPTTKVDVPAGSWNQLRIRADGRRLTVGHNGRQIQNVDLNVLAKAHSEYSGLRRTTGHIGLQHFSKPRVAFRNIRIRPLGTSALQAADASEPHLRQVSELNVFGYTGYPWISEDGRTIHWESHSPKGKEAGSWIWTAARQGPGKPFEDRKSLFPGRHPTLSADGLTIVFLENTRDSIQQLQMATRASVDKSFGDPQPLPALRVTEGNLKNPNLSTDGLELYFNRKQRSDRHETFFFVSTRETSKSQWKSPQRVPISWKGPELGLLTWIHPLDDGLTLLCTSETEQNPNRVMVATRKDRNSAFDEFRFLELPSVGPVYGRSPRYIQTTQEIYLTGPRDMKSAGSREPWVGSHQIWVIENVEPGHLNPSESSTTADAATPSDPDRAIAEWILGMKGTVSISRGDERYAEYQIVSRPADLPDEPFRLRVVNANNTKITNDDLKRLKTLDGLLHLNLDRTQINDDGMARLGQIKTLYALTVGRSRIGDRGLEKIKDLPRIDWLHAGTPHVTDRGLQHIAEMQKLDALFLPESRITDDGLKYLRSLPLKQLQLAQTNIGDAGLAHLEAIEKLKSLDLKDTKVTAAGIAKLQSALPGCKIEWDGPQSENNAKRRSF